MQNTSEHTAFNQVILDLLVLPKEGDNNLTVDMTVLRKVYETKEPTTFMLGADFSPLLWVKNEELKMCLASIFAMAKTFAQHTFIMPVSNPRLAAIGYKDFSSHIPPNIRFSVLYTSAKSLPKMVKEMAKITDRFLVTPMDVANAFCITLNEEGKMIRYERNK